MEEEKREILKKLGTKSASITELSQTQDLIKRVEHLEEMCRLMTEMAFKEASSGARDLPQESATPPPDNGVSLEKINEFVEGLLDESTTNFGWIPDALERKIDRRLLQLVLGVIAQSVSTARVKVGDGHHMTFSLHPVKDEIPSPRPPENPGDGNLDLVVFTALKSIVSTLKVEFFGHELQFHLE